MSYVLAQFHVARKSRVEYLLSRNVKVGWAIKMIESSNVNMLAGSVIAIGTLILVFLLNRLRKLAK
jgi:hypothetical protein